MDSYIYTDVIFLHILWNNSLNITPIKRAMDGHVLFSYISSGQMDNDDYFIDHVAFTNPFVVDLTQQRFVN